MTKEELVAVVDRAHALWNQSGFTPRELKAMHEAWWDMLGEFDYETAMGVLRQKALEEGPPPRPGELRRLCLEATVADMPPSPMEAWASLRAAFQQTEAGLMPDPPLHPTVRETVARMGGLSMGLWTNKDRELFLGEYAVSVRSFLSAHANR